MDEVTCRTLEAYITEERLGEGTMKQVYSVRNSQIFQYYIRILFTYSCCSQVQTVGGEHYAAKRFHRISEDDEPVSLAQNSKHIKQELLLLGEVTHMLEQFYLQGKRNAVDLDKSAYYFLSVVLRCD